LGAIQHSIFLFSSLPLPLFFSISGGLRKGNQERQVGLTVGKGETVARWR